MRARAGAVIGLVCAEVLPHLLLPPWPATYNLTRSTMTQLCFGPGMGAPPLTPETGAFLRHWGIVSLDFESQEALWTQARVG